MLIDIFIDDLVKKHWDERDPIIDLSNPTLNVFESYELKIDSLNIKNLQSIETLINVEKLTSLNLKICVVKYRDYNETCRCRFYGGGGRCNGCGGGGGGNGPCRCRCYCYRMQEIEYEEFLMHNRFFAGLCGLKKLTIQIGERVNFKSKCFKDSKIEELTIINIEQKSMNIEYDFKVLRFLTSLKKLRIEKIDFKEEDFINLNNLEVIHIENCKIDDLRSGCFKGLRTIKSINFIGTNFSNIANNVFDELESLLFLSFEKCKFKHFEISWLNCLKKLEYLKIANVEEDTEKSGTLNHNNYEQLNLPNLKYLAIDSVKIPNLKFVQPDFIKIQNLKYFKPEKLQNQVNLKALSLSIPIELYRKLDKKDFSSFDLNHLEIIIDTDEKLSKKTLVCLNEKSKMKLFMKQNSFYSLIYSGDFQHATGHLVKRILL